MVEPEKMFACLFLVEPVGPHLDFEFTKLDPQRAFAASENLCDLSPFVPLQTQFNRARQFCFCPYFDHLTSSLFSAMTRATKRSSAAVTHWVARLISKSSKTSESHRLRTGAPVGLQTFQKQSVGSCEELTIWPDSRASLIEVVE